MRFSNAVKILLSASSATLGVTLLGYCYRIPKAAEFHIETKPQESKQNTWNHNWDCRDPTALINPKKLQSLSSSGDNSEIVELLQRVTPSSTRNLFFIRHGQYVTQEKLDEHRKLTQLGKEQAICTGIRLRDFGHKYEQILESSMTRAIETSSFIQKQVKDAPVHRTDLLKEGSPINPDPGFKEWRPERNVFVDGPRIEAAFRKIVHRAEPSQKSDSYEIIVCHANVIRYFVCRALQLPPEAWLRLSLKHGSITCLSIYPDGFVTLKCLGEAGHIPSDKLSS